ncbi:hypothetical protein FGG08_002512 [Glutinoglossum americanum]|uniref:Fucose-specific lectin n=1 Tax=Glutinoglossum americanum TaxID=1670608 RepID=A0A9P8KZ44_9PEZI|nr:hypothetical protein FGG08_002512 [Glutinoglossum americanum]
MESWIRSKLITVTRTRERPQWPEPGRSAGERYRDLGRGKCCWAAIGPAGEIAERVCKDIKAVFEQREEHLREGEKEKNNLGFGVYMIGRTKEKARPTVIVYCLSPNIRKKAIALIKEKVQLDVCIRIGSIPHAPVLVARQGEMIETRHEPLGTLEPADKDARTVLLLDEFANPCGAPISTRAPTSGLSSDPRSATMGGVLSIGGEYYGLTVQHIISDDFRPDDPPGGNGDQLILEVDSEFDDEDLGDSDTSEGDHCCKEWDTRFTVIYSNRAAKLGPEYRSNTKRHANSAMIGTLLKQSHWVDEALDWLLFKIENINFSAGNEMVLNEKKLLPKRSDRDTPPDRNVWVATGNTGVVKGHISGTVFYLNIGCQKGFQKVWVVRLERDIMAGDSGSWVIDSETGDIYGHIVAGESNLAYIMPAYQIFRDIEKRFEKVVEIPTTNGLALQSDRLHLEPEPERLPSVTRSDFASPRGQTTTEQGRKPQRQEGQLHPITPLGLVSLFVSIIMIIALSVCVGIFYRRPHAPKTTPHVLTAPPANVFPVVDSGLGAAHIVLDQYFTLWPGGPETKVVYNGGGGKLCIRTKSEPIWRNSVECVEGVNPKINTPLTMLDWMGGPSIYFLSADGTLSGIDYIPKNDTWKPSSINEHKIKAHDLSQIASLTWSNGTSAWIYYQNPSGVIHEFGIGDYRDRSWIQGARLGRAQVGSEEVFFQEYDGAVYARMYAGSSWLPDIYEIAGTSGNVPDGASIVVATVNATTNGTVLLSYVAADGWLKVQTRGTVGTSDHAAFSSPKTLVEGSAHPAAGLVAVDSSGTATLYFVSGQEILELSNDDLATGNWTTITI